MYRRYRGYDALLLRIVHTGQWLADKQLLPTVAAPIYTDDEVNLYMEIKDNLEDSRGNFDLEIFTKIFNERVRQSMAAGDGRKLRIKVPKYIKEYTDLLNKRARCAGALEGILPQLRDLRRWLSADNDMEWPAVTRVPTQKKGKRSRIRSTSPRGAKARAGAARDRACDRTGIASAQLVFGNNAREVLCNHFKYILWKH